MKKEEKITHKELKSLLFWAMAGYSESNGGSYAQSLTKTIAKFVIKTKMTKGNFPPMGFKSSCPLTGETLKEILAEFDKNKIKHNN